MLTADTHAPDVTLYDGETPVALTAFRGKPLVLYFYPKDETPGCTAEACAFRDAYESFTEVGAEVVGVSSDGGASHERFKQKHRLPFRLLTDRNGVARQAFGIPKTLGILPGRVTFVIDANGVVRHVFNSQFNPGKHVLEALRVLKALTST